MSLFRHPLWFLFNAVVLLIHDGFLEPVLALIDLILVSKANLTSLQNLLSVDDIHDPSKILTARSYTRNPHGTMNTVTTAAVILITFCVRVVLHDATKCNM